MYISLFNILCKPCLLDVNTYLSLRCVSKLSYNTLTPIHQDYWETPAKKIQRFWKRAKKRTKPYSFMYIIIGMAAMNAIMNI